MNPALSVIIPVYNGEKYLRETLDSILNSEYQNIEIVIIDDGSTDGSSQIYSEYARADSRIHFFVQENAGIYAARNRGIQEAKGEFVCFCDQDDQVSRDMYSAMLKKADADQSELCLCGTAKFYGGQSVILEQFTNACYSGSAVKEKLLFPLLFANSTLASDGVKMEASIWKCIIKRELFTRYNISLKSFISFEDDWILLIELFSVCKTISTVDSIGYFWRTNLRSESHSGKYVADMEKKQKQLMDYICSVLSPVLNDKEMADFRAFRTCNDVVKLFENESSAFSPRRSGEKKAYFQDAIGDLFTEKAYLQSRNYTNACIRHRVICFLAEKKRYMAAYYANKWMQKMITMLHHLKLANRIERKLKS